MLPPDDTKSTDIVKIALSFVNEDPKFRIQGYYNKPHLSKFPNKYIYIPIYQTNYQYHFQ